MNGIDVNLLTRVVETYDDSGRPVSASDLSGEGSDVAEIETSLRALHTNHLVAPLDGGYRPTTTARELLELDLEDGAFLIVDSDPTECD